MRLREYESLYQTRVQQFIVTHPDFEKVIARDDVPLSPHLQLEMKAHEDGPALAYWLGKNPQVAFRLDSMDACSAWLELLRLTADQRRTP